jgi:Sulfotransferase family
LLDSPLTIATVTVAIVRGTEGVAAHHDLMAMATAQTSLNDLGDDSFREGLEILVRSLRDEARLNAAGEAFLYPRIVGHLAQRLQVEDWYRHHPEIDDVLIVAPLVGLGLPRTGSTALSFLLAQDPNIRYLRQWESSQPCPPPATVEGRDPRIQQAAGEKAGTKDHVPSDPNGPMECLDLMALDFKTHIYQAFAQIPSYSTWLLDADLTSTYLYERRVLKLLQWGEPVRPWRLKTPTHILFLQYLDRAFPDARFVMTHRDPTDVMLSVADVYADIAGVFTDHLDCHYLAQLNVEHWSIGMQRALKFRDGGADDRFYDIDFRAMQADPIGEVRGLYAWLGEPVTDAFESGMRRWWAQNAENREPATHPNPETFGLDLDEMRPLFAEYVERLTRWTAHPT